MVENLQTLFFLLTLNWRNLTFPLVVNVMHSNCNSLILSLSITLNFFPLYSSTLLFGIPK